MVGRRVQGFEVVVVGLGFGAGHDRIAHAEEDLGHLFDDGGDQVARADLLRAAGKRHVHGLSAHAGRKLCLLKRCLACLERLLDGDAHLVDGLADRRALFLGNLPHAAQIPGQRPFLAEHAHAHLLERRRVARRGDRCEGFVLELGKLVDQCHFTPSFLLRRSVSAAASNRRAPKPRACSPHQKSLSRLRARTNPESKDERGSRGTTLVDARRRERRAHPLICPMTGAPVATYLTSARSARPRPVFSRAARKGIDAGRRRKPSSRGASSLVSRRMASLSSSTHVLAQV